MKRDPYSLFASTALLLMMCGCATSTRERELTQSLGQCREKENLALQHLDTFDDLDFNVFSNQRWNDITHSHAADIVVHWPDGRVTKGIVDHVADLKAMFVYAPDTRIKVHPIRIGTGEWTAVEGVMEGTFTRPMPLGGGKSAKPTGKKFKLSMVTIGHWKNGVMDEEWLFWDNQAFMKQIGLAK